MGGDGVIRSWTNEGCYATRDGKDAGTKYTAKIWDIEAFRDWGDVARRWADKLINMEIGVGKKVFASYGYQVPGVKSAVEVCFRTASCDPQRTGWKDEGCELIYIDGKARFGHRYYTKLTLSSGVDYVHAANAYAPTMVGKTLYNRTIIKAQGDGKFDGSYVIVWTADPACSPTWTDEGCERIAHLTTGRFVGHRYVTQLKLPSGTDHLQAAKDFSATMKNQIVNNQRVYVTLGERGLVGGSFVVVWTIDDGCASTPFGWQDQGCELVTHDNKQVVGRRYDTQLRLASGDDYVQAADAYAPTMIGQTIKNQTVFKARRQEKLAVGSFVEAWTRDVGCDPTPIGDWTDQGCVVTPDNNAIAGHKYYVKLRLTPGVDWKSAADEYAKAQIGELVKGKKVFAARGEEQKNIGSFVAVWTTDSSCDAQKTTYIDEGCEVIVIDGKSLVGHRYYTQLKLGSGVDYVTAANAYALTLPGKKTFNTQAILKAQGDGKPGIGSYVILWTKDIGCDPKPKGEWKDQGCVVTPDKKDAGHKYYVQLDLTYGVDWKIAAVEYAKTLIGKLVGGKTVFAAQGEEQKDIGSFVAVWTRDSSCDPKPKGEWIDEGCGLVPDTGKFGHQYYVQLDLAADVDWGIAAKKYALEMIGKTVGGKIVFAAMGEEKLFIGSYVTVWTNITDPGLCDIKPKNGWVAKGCELSTNKQQMGRAYYAQLQVPYRDGWEEAAKQYAIDIIGETVEGEVVFDAVGREGLGSYVDVWTTSATCDVVWDAPVTGCDGFGSEVTIQKCNAWVNNDPLSCQNSPNLPLPVEGGTNTWIACGIGSSPGGIAPGDAAVLCDGISDTFSCVAAKNCFVVTKRTEDEKCENLIQKGLGALGGIGKIVLYVVGGVISASILLFLSRFVFRLLRARQRARTGRTGTTGKTGSNPDDITITIHK
jgi:hypothetical protein